MPFASVGPKLANRPLLSAPLDRRGAGIGYHVGLHSRCVADLLSVNGGNICGGDWNFLPAGRLFSKGSNCIGPALRGMPILDIPRLDGSIGLSVGTAGIISAAR